ncbi:hypothetical protein TSUD_402370 [Trifolium subterraneum]|uniref:Aminotransferase-like plant mobile domain-containing protein n=1 Tax=Trifolium subterraneum TaxID=3900 RepID=A0A2Z6PBA6_TRISU|nr:hypothetical protein TSUD_402370 [Trifolium subterraneum]
MIIDALHFFESSTNTFQFECGMMTPTLFDVAAITRIPPTGDTYDPTLAGSKIELKINAKSYTKYIEESLQIAKMFIPMAIQLHEGQQFGFGKLILGCLYENMRNVCENIKKTSDGSTFLGSGPFWLLQLWINAIFRVEMDLFLPYLHNEEVARRQIEGVRLARLIPWTRGLTHQQLFLQYFDAFLGLKEFKERFAPFATREIGPSWFSHPFPPLPEFEEYQNVVWLAFLTPTVISCRFGLKSTEFGLVGYFPNFVSRQFSLTQLLPKTIYLNEQDICLGYYGMTDPQFYALLKFFEGLEYGLTPFQFALSHFHTKEFHRWWDLHYESHLVDASILRPAVQAGFDAQAIRKFKSSLNARGSKFKAGSNSSAKPPFPPVKTEPGAITRKRATMAETGGPSKKAKPVETVLIDDDDVAEVEKIDSMPAPEVNAEASQLKEEKKRKKKKKKDKDSEGKEGLSKNVVYVEDASTQNQTSPRGEEQTEKKRKRKKKHKKSHSQPDPSATITSKPAVEVNEELVNKVPSVNPDSTPVKTSTPNSPKDTNLGQGETSPTVLVPETSPDSIVKNVISELNQQLEHSGEEEISQTIKVVEDTEVPTQVIVSTPDETSPPKASVEVDPNVEADPLIFKEVNNPETSVQEVLSTNQEQSSPKKSAEVVGASSTAKETEPSEEEGKVTMDVDTQASKNENPTGDVAQTQVDPPIEGNIVAQANPDPSLNEEPILNFPQPLDNNDNVVTKAVEDDEDNSANRGEYSSTMDHHQSKSRDEDKVYEATDDFLNSSAGYARTARTGDSLKDDGTSASKPVSDFYLPSHILQSVKSLTPEEALDTLLKTYGSEVPIAKDQQQELERETLELYFQKTIVEEDMLSYIDRDPTSYFNLKSLFHKIQNHSISEALSFQVTQAENFLEQYARSLQHFNRLSNDLNNQIDIPCEDNIAQWKSEIRELEGKISQEEEKKKQLEEKAVEVPRATIEEKAKIGIQHYSEALRAGVEVDRLAGEKNVVQRKLAHIRNLYDQFRQAHV